MKKDTPRSSSIASAGKKTATKKPAAKSTKKAAEGAATTRKKTSRKPIAPKVTRAPAVAGSAAAPAHEAIAIRAYQLFEARGSVHGSDMDDWLRAEAELS